MVIIFSKNKKKDLYLLGVAIALIVGLIIFWFFFLNKKDIIPEESQTSGTEAREQRIDIDFGLLENELLQRLQPFEFIVSTSTEGFGRAHPFAPNSEFSTTTSDL